MRTVLIGAVESTATALESLTAAGYPPNLLLTLDPTRGRARHSDYVDLAALADPATEVQHIRQTNAPEIVDRVRALAPDFLFIIGWSQVVGPALIAAARHFAIGFHPTALPVMRGRAPIAWTILLDVRETAASLFVIDEGIDSGPILAQHPITVDPRETADSLMDKHLDALRAMMAKLVPELAEGRYEMQAQDEDRASYCAGRRPQDGLIDWNAPAKEIDRLVRASGRPYPGAFAYVGPERLTVWASQPVELAHPHYAIAGQVLHFVDDQPVVFCGDGHGLRLIEYEMSNGARLKGQARLTREIDAS